MQEGGASFQTTHWTVVLRARETSSTESAQALSVFCEAYWPPLYAFLRHRGYAAADAQDLVQGFFAYLLAERTLSRADQERGRLRTFLLTSLQNFARDERDRAQRLKRGGGRQILSFDEHQPEAEAADGRKTKIDWRGWVDHHGFGAGYLTEAQIRQCKRQNLLAVLRKTGWKIKGINGAAELLGVKPTTLISQIERLGLRRSASENPLPG